MDEANRPSAPRTIRLGFYFILTLLYIPLLYLTFTSFRGSEGFTLKWFEMVLANPYWMSSLKISFLLGVTASILSTLVGACAALGFRFKRSVGVEAFSLAAFVMPELVFALSLLSWFAWLKFSLGFWTMLAAHVTFSLSFTFFICRSRLEKMESWLEEAALDLGASPWQTLRYIHLPLMGSALVSSFLVSFLLSFDDFLISYFVSGVGYDTLPMKLYFSMKTGLTPQLNALASLMALISGLGVYLVSRIAARS